MFDSEKHRRKSIRLKNYDYSKKGVYNLTLCTHGRAQFFGEIQAGKMIPNKEGKIAESYWKAIPEHFPNAILHDFVIMPNHIHGIIELIEPVGVEYFPPL